MSIRQGGKIIAGAKQYHPDLFDWKWADHICNDIQWLRADTFSWQSGAVYQAAYQHLADDIDGKSLQSETIGVTTIWFYLADDGHKIVPANNANLVEDIYNATGVAWYYILDTVNQRFKLPRTKFGFTGLRDNVGKYVAPGLPNITGLFYGQNAALTAASGAFFTGNNPYGGTVSVGSANNQMQFDANRSNSIYGNSTTVQPPATQMYLYFYVGTFTQTALENTAGITAETLSDKADLSYTNAQLATKVDKGHQVIAFQAPTALENTAGITAETLSDKADLSYTNAQLATKVDKGHQVIAFQAPTADNSYTWYRKYADGWVEQGGRASGDRTVYLPVVMSDANYTLVITKNDGDSGTQAYGTSSITSSSFYANRYTSGLGLFSWQVSGMAAN